MDAALSRWCDRYPGPTCFRPARAVLRVRAWFPFVWQAAFSPCLVLHRVGFIVPRELPPRAVGFYPAFSPLPSVRGLVKGLWSAGGLFSVTLSIRRRLPRTVPRAFRGTPPYGVRTFLSASARAYPYSECAVLRAKRLSAPVKSMPDEAGKSKGKHCSERVWPVIHETTSCRYAGCIRATYNCRTTNIFHTFACST